MARQSTNPVSFNRTTRKDTSVLMSSGRAGVVQPVAYIPLLAGDSASGRVGIDVKLKEMPKPLLNGVQVNFQAWFVPKSAHPQFSGRDELMHARTGEKIKALGADDREPPPFFYPMSNTHMNVLQNSQMGKALGLHFGDGAVGNVDLIDAFNLIYNFRLAAHSSRLERRKYALESLSNACKLPPAFWPSSRFSRVVPDYERALVVGSLDLDVIAGQLPLTGFLVKNETSGTTGQMREIGPDGTVSEVITGEPNSPLYVRKAGVSGTENIVSELRAEMGGASLGISLADIDKARTTQAFAKARSAYAGNDATGFDNDDTIIAHLMQGISVSPDDFKRPWLLDSKRVPVGFTERPATDGANLDMSVSTGITSAQLSLNVPQQDVSGMIIVTMELLPERIDERMADEFLMLKEVDSLPNALRDVQRVEPVDLVLNRRIDAKHTSPDGLYGYEPMNDVWNRDFTRLGGDFYMATPGGGWTENRSNIWQTEMVDPTFSDTHYLAPSPFPHDVFADSTADCFEVVCRHAVSIVGLTQIGDVLAENNDDYEAVTSAGV